MKKGKTDAVETEGRLCSSRPCILGPYLLISSVGGKYRQSQKKVRKIFVGGTFPFFGW